MGAEKEGEREREREREREGGREGGRGRERERESKGYAHVVGVFVMGPEGLASSGPVELVSKTSLATNIVSEVSCQLADCFLVKL